MTWSHVTKVEKIKTRLSLMDRLLHEGQVGVFGAMDRVAVKLEQDLAPIDEDNGKKQVRSRSMSQQGHMMI
jgi:hypothetical protein